MIPKPAEKITKADIENLIANKVAEGRTIEYKLTLPGGNDADKREFLADVSSFANAGGGDILYGVRAKDGVPLEAPGLAGITPDAEKLRLSGTIQTGIEPRILGMQIETITGFSQGPVVLIRVPQSWVSPHMVVFGNVSRFFTRTTAGKHQMDVGELRSAFALSESVPERIRQFRADRLGKIVAGETPVLLDQGAKLVFHIVPVASLAPGFQRGLPQMKDQLRHFIPMTGGGSQRFNIDGLLLYGGDGTQERPAHAYCQLFRDGQVEFVRARLVRPTQGGQALASVWYEETVLQAAQSSLNGLRALEIPLPLVILLSMTGVAGAIMWVGPFLEGHPIDRDTLLLPDVLVEDYGADVHTVLRPVFDAVWNAAGYERSFNYDAEGNWKPRR